ncbi:MAG: lipid A deacylase LpxR family protein [Geminicoccaceae bacterium]
MRSSRSFFSPAVILVVGIWSSVTFAQGEGQKDYSFCDVFTLQAENDEAGNSDRNYTSGFRYACTGSTPKLLSDLILSEGPPGSIQHSRTTYGIAHSTFTPGDLTRSDVIEDDQPYAGWLYFTLGLEWETIPKPDRLRYLDKLELQLGVIGPLSGAEQIQRTTHDILGATDPQGWDNQLENEPGINLFYSRQWTGAQGLAPSPGEGWMPKLAFDVTPKVGLALGNVHIFGAGGLMFRLGNFLPEDHGPPTLRPSLPGSDVFPRREGTSAYLFGGVEGRVVGRNVFLDGSTFDDDSPGVDKNRFVGEARVGATLTIHNVRLSYTHVFRSREFRDERAQVYGALTLSVAL